MNVFLTCGGKVFIYLAQSLLFYPHFVTIIEPH